jgi:hypothetical protein
LPEELGEYRDSKSSSNGGRQSRLRRVYACFFFNKQELDEYNKTPLGVIDEEYEAQLAEAELRADLA